MKTQGKYNTVIVKEGKATVQEVEDIPLKEGEVKIRVEASPINPADKMWLVGMYGIKELIPEGPLGAGFEGAGVVTHAHPSVGDDLVGKTVAFFEDCHTPTFQGAWRKFLNRKASELVPMPEGIKPTDVFASFINPLTAILIVSQAKKFGHKALVHGAACSALGKMLTKYAKKIDFPVIHLVRRKEQADTLRDLGAEHILDSSVDTFEDDLKKLSAEVGATAYFDPIAGDFCSKVLTKLPAGSTAYVYGALSGGAVTMSPIDIIFYQKSVSYLYIATWFKESTVEEQTAAIGEVAADLAAGGEIFGSKIVKTYSVDQFQEAVEETDKHASEGKIVINPQL